jgi:hypothetical protein
MARPFKFNVQELKELYKKYRAKRAKEYDSRFEPIKSGERAGEIIEIKMPKVPTILSFCHFIGITEKTFFNWINAESVNIDEELLQFITYVQEEMKDYRLSAAMNNTINPQLVSRFDAYKDVQQVEQTNPEQINISIDGMKIDLTK